MKAGSWFSFVLLFLACGVNLTATVLPMWLYNEPFGQYARSRRWGLLRVVGYQTRSHKHTFDAACSAEADLTGLGNCIVGACPHFRDRCHAWKMMMFTSYTVAGLIFMATTCFGLGMVVSLRESIKTLKMSAVSIAIGCLLQIVGITTYFFCVRTVFTIVNTHGVYPVPNPSLCFYLAIGAMFLGFSALTGKVSAYRARKNEADFTEDVRRQVRDIRSTYGFD